MLFFLYIIYFGSKIWWKIEICNYQTRIITSKEERSKLFEKEYQSKVFSRGRKCPKLL